MTHLTVLVQRGHAALLGDLAVVGCHCRSLLFLVSLSFCPGEHRRRRLSAICIPATHQRLICNNSQDAVIASYCCHLLVHGGPTLIYISKLTLCLMKSLINRLWKNQIMFGSLTCRCWTCRHAHTRTPHQLLLLPPPKKSFSPICQAKWQQRTLFTKRSSPFRLSVGKKKKRRSDLICSVRPPASAPRAVHASQANHRGSSSWMVDRRDWGRFEGWKAIGEKRATARSYRPTRPGERTKAGRTVNSSSLGDENVSVLRRHDFWSDPTPAV